MKATWFKIKLSIKKKSYIYNLSLKFKPEAVKYKQILNKDFILKLVTKVCAEYTNFTQFAKYLQIWKDKSYNSSKNCFIQPEMRT